MQGVESSHVRPQPSGHNPVHVWVASVHIQITVADGGVSEGEVGRGNAEPSSTASQAFRDSAPEVAASPGEAETGDEDTRSRSDSELYYADVCLGDKLLQVRLSDGEASVRIVGAAPAVAAKSPPPLPPTLGPRAQGGDDISGQEGLAAPPDSSLLTETSTSVGGEPGSRFLSRRNLSLEATVHILAVDCCERGSGEEAEIALKGVLYLAAPQAPISTGGSAGGRFLIRRSLSLEASVHLLAADCCNHGLGEEAELALRGVLLQATPTVTAASTGARAGTGALVDGSPREPLDSGESAGRGSISCLIEV